MHARRALLQREIEHDGDATVALGELGPTAGHPISLITRRATHQRLVLQSSDQQSVDGSYTVVPAHASLGDSSNSPALDAILEVATSRHRLRPSDRKRGSGGGREHPSSQSTQCFPEFYVAAAASRRYNGNMCSTVDATLDGVLGGLGGRDEEILALVGLIDRAQAALVERVGVFDAAEEYAADGAFSFACWLRARADVSRAESLQLERFARRLRTMPATHAAVHAGKLPVTKARLLAGVINERTIDRFHEQETFLLDQVQGLSVDHAKVALDHWKRWADTDGPDPSDPDRNRAALTLDYNGRWHLDADLDPVNGALLKATLQAIQDRMHQDGRFADLTGVTNTASRRLAEALIELANPDRATVHPDVIVTIPADTIHTGEENPFDPPTIIDAGPITYHEAIRLAFHGTVSLLTIDDQGRPLNLGRKVRLATTDQWIAGAIWHRGCVMPGCDRPASWCHAHHQKYWSDGGPTDLANLPFVCTRHHHLIHDQHWKIHRLDNGTWQFQRPDGTVVEAVRYPGHDRARAPGLNSPARRTRPAVGRSPGHPRERQVDGRDVIDLADIGVEVEA